MHSLPRAHVPQLAVSHALSACRRMGIELGTEWKHLEAQPNAWIEWGQVARALNALEPRFGDEQPKLFADLYVNGHPILRLLEPLGLSAFGLTELITRAYSTCSQLYEETSHEFRGRLVRVRARQRAELEPCPLWWRLWCEVFTAAPQAIGQPPLVLRSFTTNGRGLDATWELPPPRPPRTHRFAPHTREALTMFLPVLTDLETVDHLGPQPADDSARLQQHGLTRAEARVALHIADGLTPRETATELGVAYETVRTHLRSIYQALEVSSQRELATFIDLWRRPQ